MVEQIVILLQRLGVLTVGRPDTPDGRHAQRNEVAVGLRAVTLEVAVQPPLAFGHGQGIVGQGEMIHADVDIPGVAKRIQRARQHGDL